MSYGLFADKPLPSDRRCPYCGEVTTSAGATCWLCLEKFSIQAETAEHPRGSKSAASVRPGAASGDNLAWVVVGILTFILCVGYAGIAFEGGGGDPLSERLLMFVVPVLVLATPALIRTLVTTSRNQDPTAPTSGLTFVGIFLSSLGVTAMVGVASFVAFFATCVGLGIGGFTVTGSDLIHPGANAGVVTFIILVSIGAGLVAGLAIAIWLFRLFWRHPPGTGDSP